MAKLEKKIQKRAARKPRTALFELKSYLKSIVNVFLNTSTIVIESTSSIASWVSETISAEYLNINKMTNQAKTPIKKRCFSHFYSSISTFLVTSAPLKNSPEISATVPSSIISSITRFTFSESSLLSLFITTPTSEGLYLMSG